MQVAALPYELLLQELVHLLTRGLNKQQHGVLSNDHMVQIAETHGPAMETSEQKHQKPLLLLEGNGAAKLEEVGREIGMRFSERFMSDRNGAAFTEELEAIKCICRDLWPIINGHKCPIENLKTNHQGTYVLGWHVVDSNKKHIPNPVIIGMVVGFLSALGIHVSATGYPGSLHLTRI